MKYKYDLYWQTYKHVQGDGQDRAKPSERACRGRAALQAAWGRRAPPPAAASRSLRRVVHGAPFSMWQMTALGGTGSYRCCRPDSQCPLAGMQHPPLAMHTTRFIERDGAPRIMLPMHSHAGEQADRDAMVPGQGWSRSKFSGLTSTHVHIWMKNT
jgi:hypothetical protein